MKVGITGAAGGIGSCLSDALYERGIETVLIDNLSGGSLENFQHKDNADSVKNVDIRDSAQLLPLLSEVDVIVHLAAISSLAACQKNPVDAFSVNVSGTASCVNIATKTGAKLIFASTSAVYENTKTLPFREDDFIQPSLVYPMTKKFSEDLLFGLQLTNDLNFLNLRFFNVFGPRQDVKRANPPLINYLVREHVLGRKPKIYAPLSQARDYVHVFDIIEMIMKFIDSKDAYPNRTYNVCSGRAISIAEIFTSLELGFGEQIPFEQGEPSFLWEMHAELFDGALPLKLQVVEKETLKESIGNPERSANEFSWTARRNVLEEIANSVPEMRNRVALAFGS